MVSFSEAVKTCMTKKFATMSGRATLAEYWWFQLFIWGTSTCIFLLSSALGRDAADVGFVIFSIFFVITLIPNLCVCVRRLHDTGHSGAMFWWCLLGWVIGLLIINVINMFASDDDNEYGPNPLKPIKEDSNPMHETEIIQEDSAKEEQIEEITDVVL